MISSYQTHVHLILRKAQQHDGVAFLKSTEKSTTVYDKYIQYGISKVNGSLHPQPNQTFAFMIKYLVLHFTWSILRPERNEYSTHLYSKWSNLRVANFPHQRSQSMPPDIYFLQITTQSCEYVQVQILYTHLTQRMLSIILLLQRCCYHTVCVCRESCMHTHTHTDMCSYTQCTYICHEGQQYYVKKDSFHDQFQ